jgi:hypothetical protein
MANYDQLKLKCKRLIDMSAPTSNGYSEEYRLPSGLPCTGLTMLGVMFTNRCNADCSFCGIKKGSFVQEDLSVTLVKSYIDQAPSAGIHVVGFTGGEALLRHDDLISCIEHAKSKHMQSTLMSNASYAVDEASGRRVAGELSRAGLVALGISFDVDHLKYIPMSSHIHAIRGALRNNISVTLKVINRKDTFEQNLSLLEDLSKKLPGDLENTRIRVKGKLLVYVLSNGIRFGKEEVSIEKGYVERFGNAKRFEHDDLFFKGGSELAKCKSESIVIRSDGMVAMCCGVPMIASNQHILGDANTSDLRTMIRKANATIPYRIFKDVCGITQSIEALRSSGDPHLVMAANGSYTSECDFCNRVLSDQRASAFLAREFNLTLPEAKIASA